MSRSKHRWTRGTFRRFSLPLGVCAVAGMIHGAHAQSTTFDPFAPDAIAPQAPTANPTAPKPVAPVLPPRIHPMPAKPVQAGTSLPAPTAAPAAPAPRTVTPLPTPTQAPPQVPASTTAPLQVQSPAPAAPTMASPTQAGALTDAQKLQQLQNALGPTQDTLSATPFEQTSLAPTQPVAAPKITQPTAPATPVTTQAAEPTPPLTRPLPKPTFNQEQAAPSDVTVADTPSTTPDTPAQPEANLLENIGNFFGNLFNTAEDTPAETQSVREEATTIAPDTTESPSDIKEESVDETPPQQQVDAQPSTPAPVVIDPRLTNATFALGSDIFLGQSTSALSQRAQCFTKNRGMVTYCLNPTTWASTLTRFFDVSSHLYKGEQAIIQFDGEIATRLYTLFNAEGFGEIVRYFEEKLGPATHHFSRTARTLKQGDVDNPTYVWRKENEVEGLTEVFEIRQIADTRGSLPDLKRGSIRVYYEGARSIFSLSSDLDFMQLH